MFSNFKDNFIRKPQYNAQPPQAVLAAISKGLPDGFSYVYDHDGFCRLDSKDGFNLNSGKVVLPPEAREIFQGAMCTDSDLLMQYAYNAQVKLPILPCDDGCYIVNGKKFKSTDFIKAPLKNLTPGETRFFLVPPAFPAPFHLTVSCDGYALILIIRRKPNNSISMQKYESADDSPLKLSYLLEPDITKSTFTISISIGKSKSVEDAVSANHIYNSFLTGKGFIGGTNIIASPSSKVDSISDDTIIFWDQILELEKLLNVKFDASADVTVNEADKVEELYQSIVAKKPFKVFQTYQTVSGSGKSHKIAEGNDIIGKEMFFEFTETEEVDLLGVHLKYWALVAIFGATVKAISFPPDDKMGNFKIELCTTEGKKMYASTMYFLEESQLEGCRSDKNHIETFEKAEELQYIVKR